MYIDHSRPPFIDVSLPPAIILPEYLLIILYSVTLLADFYLLTNERHLRLTSKQARLFMTVYHIAIPMIFISSNQPRNILYAATPWFLASYTAYMSTNTLTLKSWSDAMVAITIEDDRDEQYTLTKRRLKGAARIALGVFKLVMNHLFISPLLPNHAEYALDYPWLHPMSLIYTFLYGMQAYCFLGMMEIFLGLQQLVFGWKMVELQNYPFLSTSPRDFWSRRWNKIIRNLLHEQIFTKKEEQLITPVIKAKEPVVTQRMTRSKTRAAVMASLEEDESIVVPKYDSMVKPVMKASPSFWSTRRGRGLLSFIVSGAFHELIIMSTCRKMTLENLAFFTIEGILVMAEVDLRQGVYKQEPTGKMRLICIILHLVSLTIIGRLFTGPFLRYDFFS